MIKPRHAHPSEEDHARRLRIMHRGERRAKFLANKNLYYVWGGSHQFVVVPLWSREFDCSSYVSHLLQVMGFGCPTTTTSGLAEWGKPGAGSLITIMVRTNSPELRLSSAEEHTILHFHNPEARTKDRFTECGGGTNPNPRGGPTYFRPSATYLDEFNVLRHPHGF